MSLRTDAIDVGSAIRPSSLNRTSGPLESLCWESRALEVDSVLPFCAAERTEVWVRSAGGESTRRFYHSLTILV